MYVFVWLDLWIEYKMHYVTELKILPLETIIGRMHCRANFMGTLSIITGSKSNIFGYISKGDKVYKRFQVK